MTKLKRINLSEKSIVLNEQDMKYCGFKILLSVCLLLSGCGQNSKDKANGVPVIEVVQNLGKYQKIPLSQFVSELEYVSLETNDDCLFAHENTDLILTSTYIFIRGSKYCYVFSRDGRFLRQIGRVGQGPGEYTNLISFSIDEKTQSLYLETFNMLLEYSWDGVFRRSINLPKNIYGETLRNIFFVRDSLFVGHFRNHKGDLLHNFVLFNQSSEVAKLFDNYVQFKRTREMASWTESAMKPYRIEECVYVKELGNDTLFYLTEQNELLPHFVFDIGEYTITKEKKESQVSIINGIYGEEIVLPDFLPIIDTQNHLFFSLRAYSLSRKYSFPKEIDILTIAPSSSTGKNGDWHVVVGIYDIANQTTQLLDTDPVSGMLGMINDLDGGLSFWPRYYSSDNEPIDIWRADDMKLYLTEAYFSAHEIKNPEAHQKLRDLLRELDDTDNPVIIIGKYKRQL